MSSRRLALRHVAVATLAVGLLAPMVPAMAEAPFPTPPVDDVGNYPATTFIDNGSCDDGDASDNDLPTTFDCEDDWKFTDWRDPDGDPQVAWDPHEFFGVKGASLNRAWEVTTGRPDVVIAVLDSGIRWEEAGREDLVRKHFVNRHELPRPQDAEGAERVNADDTHFDGYDVDGDQDADGVPDGVPDGMFSVVDFWSDPRVDDHNANGVIDPEDLIRTFSDGVDDDGNGYVDDISGWDFFEDDNDPQDDVDYGHGTGEAEDSGGEANLEEGTCPNCMIMSMRVGDSFVADVNHFAEAVTYAVDNGASVIQEALGTLNHTSYGQAAVDHAYRNGVIVNASMADEAAGHHMWPAAYDHTMPVNSIVDASLPTTVPQSTLYFNGCTNFGGYMYIAVPSSSCSSEATGRSSGYSGLLYSAALNAIERGSMTPYVTDDGSAADFPLSAEEAMQLWRLSADDIDFASTCGHPVQPDHDFCDDAPDDVLTPLAPPDDYVTTIPLSQRYTTTRGWDYFTGYGRSNAATLVRMIGLEGQDGADDVEYLPSDGEYGVGSSPLTAQDRIPPEADIQWPRWWGQYGYRPDGTLVLPDDPADPDAVVIHGRAAANRVTTAGGTFDWVLEYAPHVQGDASLDAVGDSEEDSGGPWTEVARAEGLTAAVEGELARIPVGELAAALAGTPNPFTGAEDPTSEFQPEQYAIRLRLRVLAHPANAADDVNNEAVHQKQIDVYPATEAIMRDDLGIPAPDAPGAGIVDLLNDDALGRYAGGAGSPSYHDLDGDGIDELLLPTSDGVVHAFTDVASGTELPGWPVLTDPYDGIVRHMAGDGTTPVDNAYTRGEVVSDVATGILLGTLAVADLDDDGTMEVAIGDMDGRLHVWEHDGTPRDGFPVRVDLGLSKEVSCEGRGTAAGSDGRCDDDEVEAVTGPDAGGPKRDRWNGRDWGINSAPVVGDLDPTTPGLEIVSGANDSHVHAWHADGTPVDGWPVVLRDPTKVAAMDPQTRFWTYTEDAGQAIGSKVLVSPSLGDIDGDGDLEVVIGVNEEYVEAPNAAQETDPLLGVLAQSGVIDPGNTRLYALHHTGADTAESTATEATPHVHDQAYVDGWPVSMALLVTNLLPYVAAGPNTQAVLFDADGDGTLEIAAASAAGPGYLFDHDGSSHLGTGNGGDRTFATTTPGAASLVASAATTIAATLPTLLAGLGGDVARAALAGLALQATATVITLGVDLPSYVALGGMAAGSMDGGDAPSVVGASAGLRRVLDVVLEAQQLGGQDHVNIWDPATGRMDQTSPIEVNDLQFFSHPTIADVTGDGLAEVMQGTAVGDLVTAGNTDTSLFATRHFTGGWIVMAPTVGAGPTPDRQAHLTSVTREGFLRLHPTGMVAGSGSLCDALTEWPEYGHDPHNTGNDTVDAVRPGPLADLEAVPDETRRLLVTVTATGDDRSCGTAAGYELRLASSSTQTWDDAAPLPQDGDPAAPSAAGTTDGIVTAPVPVGTHWLLVRARDEASNGSTVARVRVTVPDGPEPPEPPTDLVTIQRIFGNDRFATGVEVSRAQFPTDGSASAVVIARGDEFADALAGTPLAVAEDAPLLLTRTDALLPEVEAELRRVLPTQRVVHLLGGEAALAPAVEDRLRDLGYRVERHAGDTRYDTAVAIAGALGNPDTVLVTRGDLFPDGLTAGVAAAHVDGAVLLTPPERRGAQVDAYLADEEPATVYAVGGPAARPYPEATALVGDDRIATAVAVAARLVPTFPAVGIARADVFADALTGGVDSARRGGPVLLTHGDRLDPRVRSAICAGQDRLRTIVLYGGTAALDDGVESALADLAAGNC